MKILIENIKGLLCTEETPVPKINGKDMATLAQIEHAWLLVKDDNILDFGSMERVELPNADEVIDASGKYVMPAFVDSHSHIIFASSREEEFVDKIKGRSYAEIAAKGGGILNSAKKLQQTSEEALFESAMQRVNEVIAFGTGALEIKSGYGLTVEDELKMLRVARRIGRESPLTVKTTFLGAHAIPKEYTHREDYIKLVKEQMIPRVAEEGLADYCDVFCETGFFTPQETEDILGVGLKYGLVPKIHANQLHNSGGVQVGVKMGARSVDHLETMGQAEINTLKGHQTMATLLPGAAFFLNMSFPPARELMEANVAVALATDYNPGSAPCGKMPLMLSLACIKMRMTPEEAINAATLNGAFAMDVQDKLGSIARGKIANLIITKKMNSYAFIPYAFGSDTIDKVMLNGKWVI